MDAKVGQYCGNTFGGEDNAWSSIDLLVYGHNAIHAFVSHSDRWGDIVSVEICAFRVNLVKGVKERLLVDPGIWWTYDTCRCSCIPDIPIAGSRV